MRVDVSFLNPSGKPHKAFLSAIFWGFALGFVSYNAARVLMGLNSNIQIHGFAGVAFFGVVIALIQVVTGSRVGRLIDTIGALSGLVIGSLMMVTANVIGLFMSAKLLLLVSYTVLLSLAALFINVAAQKGVGEAPNKDQRTQCFAWLSQLVALTNVVGPIAIGLVVSRSNQFVAYAVLLVISIISAMGLFIIFFLFINPRKDNKIEENQVDLLAVKSHPSPKTSSWKNIIAHGQMEITLCSCVLFACVTSFILFTPILATNRNLNADDIGWIIGLYGLAAILSRFFLAQITRYISEKLLLLLGFLLAALGFGLLVVAQPLLLFLVASILLGIGFGWGLPLTISLTHQNAEKGQEAELLAKLVAMNKLAEAIVLSISILTSGKFLLALPFLLNACLVLLAVSVLGVAMYRNRNVGDSK